MSQKKKIPNPYGKLGGPEHQKKVLDIVDEMNDKPGLKARIEQILRFFSGKKRFMDIAGLDEDTDSIVELHQVGKARLDGNPVKRERVVLDEVEKEFGIRPEIHAYNRKKNEK